MAHYYNYGGGCIHGDCLAETQNGFINVSSLKKGDTIKTKSGYSKIKCVLVTEVNS
jgi:hypothetical protein